MGDPSHSDTSTGLEQIAALGRRRRRRARRVLDTTVEIEVDAGQLDGRTRDVSGSGMLLVTEGDLRIRVSFELDGQPVERTGRLVRSQPMGGGETALAIQFDDELEQLGDL